MTREELLSSREYWITSIQTDLYNEVEGFMEKEGINRKQLAEKLHVGKSYVSQLLNGDFDHKVSKLVDLSLSIGMVPLLTFMPLADYVQKDQEKYPNQIKEEFVFKTPHIDLSRFLQINQDQKVESPQYSIA